MNTNDDPREALAPVRECLQGELGEQLLCLVLFGSHARGEATEDSDWDVLLVAKGLSSSVLERKQMLRSVLPRYWRYRVSFVARTPEEFESANPPLFLDIALDGLIVHDMGGYAKDRLAAIRQTIKEKGLFRERRGGNWIWLKEASPAPEEDPDAEMDREQQAFARLRVAQIFLAEARQDLGLGRWLSCVGQSQVAVQHALKSAIALWRPIPHTRQPARTLLDMLEAEQIPATLRGDVEALVDMAEVLNVELRAHVEYGEEVGGATPLEVVGQEEAEHAHRNAERVLLAAKDLFASASGE